MKVAIASGKGGTGKTTIATSLSHLAANLNHRTVYADCDVEEPNGHLFLKPDIRDTRSAGVLVPVVNEDACIHCGLCGDVCLYNAIVTLGGRVLVYPDLCHNCGGCALLCPVGVICETSHEIGTIDRGKSGTLQYIAGRLNVGQISCTPLIRAVKQDIPKADLVIIDAPPGTACPLIETLHDCDLALLVTEPTPFGLHDLKRAVQVARTLDLPVAVIINRADIGNGDVRDYCASESIRIIAEIPNDRRVAEAYSQAKLITSAIDEYTPLFTGMLADIIEYGKCTN